MNTKNLIITPTLEMSREDWLDFRRPVTHAKQWLIDCYLANTGKDVIMGSEVTEIFKQSELAKKLLTEFFTNPLWEWESVMLPVLGASEVGTVMGLNPYKSIIELFYEKVGLKEDTIQDNSAMFWGRELEKDIAEKWQYWEGSEQSLIENYTNGRQVRKCRRFNAYLQNKEFPWLFVSLDRIMNKGKSEKEGSLECKTISGYSAGMWENGIPPMYVVQLQTQLGVCEFDFGEIALLKDGRQFEVLPFDVHPEIFNRVKEKTKWFHDLVKKGVENFLLYLYSPDERDRLNYLANIDALAPEADGSISYESYLSNRYKDEGREVLGNDELYSQAREYILYNSKIKEIEEKQRLCSNKLKDFMKDAATLSFGDRGKVTWKVNAKNVRVFGVKVKVGEEIKMPAELES